MSLRKIKLQYSPRQEVIEWINSILEIDLTMIEQLGSGSVFCQLLNSIHANAIPKHKINFQGQNQYQFLANFRLLQDAFFRLGIECSIDPQKLVKAKYQDNYELASWFKSYTAKHLQETDCSLSTSLGQDYDFTFARKAIIQKKVVASPIHNGSCECCRDKRARRRLLRKFQELQVQFEMIEEVLLAQQDEDQKVFLIEEIIGLGKQ